MVTIYAIIGIIALILIVILAIKTFLVLKESETAEKESEKEADEVSQKKQKILIITGLIALVLGIAVFIAAVFLTEKSGTSGQNVDTGSAAYSAGFLPAIWIPFVAARKKGEKISRKQKLIMLGITWLLVLLMIAGFMAWYLLAK